MATDNELKKTDVENERDDIMKGISTIPNVITILRIFLAPFFMAAYIGWDNFVLSLIILVLSALSDFLDGMLARKYNQVSAFGKIMDPIADKLSQLAILLCMVIKFPMMLLPMIVFLFKEAFNFIVIYFHTKYVGKNEGAKWYGKVSTFVFYAVMILHFLWIGIPALLSQILIYLTSGLLLLACVMYGIRYISQIVVSVRKIRSEGKKNE